MKSTTTAMYKNPLRTDLQPQFSRQGLIIYTLNENKVAFSHFIPCSVEPDIKQMHTLDLELLRPKVLNSQTVGFNCFGTKN